MSDEKKKGGFWSWFGLGKNKQEESTEPKEPESKEQLPNESEVQETAEKTTALSDEAETENTLTEDTSMAQASTLVPEAMKFKLRPLKRKTRWHKRGRLRHLWGGHYKKY